MSHPGAEDRKTPAAAARPRMGAMSLAVVGAATGLLGCSELGEIDAWLFDQSVVGRWEYTPTVVPILERIDVIERDTGDFIEITQATPEDLIPVVSEYVVGAGDQLRLSILDFLRQGEASDFELVVDQTGTLDIPQLGRVPVDGLTVEELRKRVAQITVERQITMEEPVVGVNILRGRKSTFSIIGSLQGVGRYAIPNPDYRLLEALTEAGGISPAIRKVQVIRQVKLAEEARSGAGAKQPVLTPKQASDRPAAKPDGGPDLTKLIEELTGPDGAKPGAGKPGEAAKPATPATPKTPPAPGAAEPAAAPPPIDLPDSPSKPGARPTKSAGESSWMFLNGEWVKVARAGDVPAGAGLPESAKPAAGKGAEELVTQRVIEIPTGPLLKGLAQYNIVIRPGDVIHVKGPDIGLIYISGPGINRTGVYDMPGAGRLTLKQAISAAGGLSAIAIPERVDITRRIGDDREATIRLNLRAIYEGTQPDIFLKPEDQINVGTNFFATPLAIIRSGFRISYGFGFLADRNFGSDVFGVPPEIRNRFGF